jgi:hypothetical protein
LTRRRRVSWHPVPVSASPRLSDHSNRQYPGDKRSSPSSGGAANRVPIRAAGFLQSRERKETSAAF